jgi:hypothetical protein
MRLVFGLKRPMVLEWLHLRKHRIGSTFLTDIDIGIIRQILALTAKRVKTLSDILSDRPQTLEIP